MVATSFVMITARQDFPFLHKPDLHIFEPTLEAFKNQTNKDFECIIVDTLYEQRKNYFKDKDLPFHVKHVPAQPNVWIEHGFPGICAQYNKGIIYADGQLLFFTGEGYLVESHFMEELWKRYQRGYFPLAWYLYDNTFSQDVQKTDWGKTAENTKSPVPYNILGHTGENVTIEHRYFSAFKGHDLKVCGVPWDWWFGCSSASLEAMLKINGFDQNFDGDKMLLDCDVGSRLDLAGYSMRFALSRNIFLIRIPPCPGWNPNFTKFEWTIKCNYALLGYSRMRNRYQANTYKLSDEEIEEIKKVYCQNKCGMSEFCKKNHPWQYPFEHKTGYVGHHSSKTWFNFWKNHQTIIDLTQERQKRLNGDKKYQEGTFT